MGTAEVDASTRWDLVGMARSSTSALPVLPLTAASTDG